MPRPNSHLAAAKAHLGEHGETRASDLAIALGAKQSSVVASLKHAIDRGEIVLRKEGRAAFYSLGDGTAPVAEADTEEEVEEPRFCLWDDGDLQVWGVEANEDGSFTIPLETLGRIKARIAWSPIVA